MRRPLPPLAPFVPHAVLIAALAVFAAAGCSAPGFVAAPAPSGPSLAVRADVGADGSRATLHVVAHDVGDALGVSVHLAFDPAHVAVQHADAAAFLGDDARTIALVNDGDVALGGSHTTAVESAVADGDIATVELRAVSAGSSDIALVDALARRADGSFVPLAVAGGALEVAP